ncbi:MAG: ABC transporter ATP-binding protein [Gemmatimonadota bacterium]
MTDVLASLRGVVRRFGPVTALAGADLEVRSGEVHGVLGENGAGKTTLLSVLGGILRPDAGTLEIAGRVVELSGPRAAWEHGVGLVHQHFTLVPRLTVLENLSLGRDPGVSGAGLPSDRVREAALRLSERTGLSVPLEATVEDLGVGERQRVEILKALLREPPILVLDEPTAVLTPGEVESLFTLLRDLAAQGKAVVLVAHKINEVLSVSHRVTVLRRGRTVLTSKRDHTDAPSLIRAMVGDGGAVEGVSSRDVAEAVGGGDADALDGITGLDGDPVARLVRVIVVGRGGSEALHEVSLSVARGEIVGVAGVEGNGQRELALVLAGRLGAESGDVEVPAGVGFVPQDRTVEGIVPDFDLVENTALALHDDPRFGKGPWLDWRAARMEAERVVSRFGVVAPGVEARAGALSGGNQQRLVVGRELMRASDFLVAENPTRGLDVAATAFVHSELRRLAGSPTGPAIVLVSTDLDEVLALSSRILVIVRGRLRAVPEGSRSRQGIGALMLSGGKGHA